VSDYDQFKKKDKSEKVTVLHVEPVRQLIRWTDEGGERFTKLLTTDYTKTNAILIGMVRDQVDMIDYRDFNFLEDGNGNPLLTGDLQFFLVGE